MDTIGFDRHDHAACISGALAAASERCEAERLKLTPMRRHVLEILLREHRAMGAYEILDILRDEGHAAQPPVAYRALDFLTRHGFAHRIEKLSAFVACAHPEAEHRPAFLICDRCNSVAEALADPAGGALGAAAEATGFALDRTVVEAGGICPACQRRVAETEGA